MKLKRKHVSALEALYATYLPFQLSIAQRLDRTMRGISRRGKHHDTFRGSLTGTQPCYGCERWHDHNTSCVLPLNAPFYVVSNQIGIKRVIGSPRRVSVVPCATFTEAQTVQKYVQRKKLEHNVRIVTRTPYCKGRVCYLRLIWRYIALGVSVPGE